MKAGEGGKDNGKGKGVVKSDNWSKSGKGKGSPSKGKGKGKKGKMNEVSGSETWDWTDWTNETWTDEDQWWHSEQYGWNDWNVESMQEPWNANAWQTTDWDETSWNETNWDETQTKLQTDGTGKVVGSLILSPVLHVDGCCSETCQTGLFLGDSDCEMDVCESFGTCVFDHETVFETNNSFFHETNNSFLHDMSFARLDFSKNREFQTTFGLSGSGTSDVDTSQLLCRPGRVMVVKPEEETRSFFNEFQETSVARQMEPHLRFLEPLLSQLADQHDASWWLLDSGASTTVLAESSAAAFSAAISPQNVEGFSAANGSQVRMCGTAEVGVHMFMSTSTGDERIWKKARLKVLVGNIKHNILSVTSLADSGWRFTQGPKGFDLYHDQLGLHCLETAYFANCPWVRLHPDTTAPTSVSALGVVNAVSVSESLLCPLSKEASDELEQHRRQGHMPFNAQCLECNRGRSVFQHRRKKEGSKDAELQADFCFLSQTGEVSLEESERAVKILVIAESMSGCLGAIVIGSDNKAVQRQLKEWLDHFGLLSKETSIVIRTDAEISVGELIGRSVGNYNFMVRRAGPQQHRSIGSAERGVREIKESLSVLRSDLNGQGLDIAFSESGLTDCLTYLCLCHNHFGKVHGTAPLRCQQVRNLGSQLFPCLVHAFWLSCQIQSRS